MWRPHYVVLLCIWWQQTSSISTNSSPDVPSTVLQLHNVYTQNPPHDTSLYDVLNVLPNSTATQITKSYRRLSRKYHPDKSSSCQSRLTEVQQAYEILKDDATRLPYHRYGLTDPNVAVVFLLGPHHSHVLDAAHDDLLQLMGHDGMAAHGNHGISPAVQDRRQRRVRLMAARLVERLRPLVEGSIDPKIASYQLAQECDRWKRLPLGAQVIRCIGRAYRHAGQDYLRRQDPSVSIRQKWRQAKAFLTAAMAGSRATMSERALTRERMRRQRNKEKRKLLEDTSSGDVENSLDDVDAIFSEDESASDLHISLEEEEEEYRQAQRYKAKQTLLTSLQVDALWKVAKIDLDQTVREACQLILQGDNFPPSHQSWQPDGLQSSGNNPYGGTHGWVTSQGRILHTNEACRRAAEALVLLGELMVQRSKVGTSWKE